jgi:glycosyltransferase involved in cell wall biosynthesis
MTVDIALFIHSLAGGGAERVAVLLANEFARRGLAIDLVLQRKEGPYLTDVAAEVRVVDLNSELRQLPWRFATYMKSTRPASLLSLLTAHNVVAAIVGPRHAGSIVVCEQNSIEDRKRAAGDWQTWLFPILRFVYDRVNKVVAVSQQLSDELVRLGIPADRLVFIPNPVDQRLLELRQRDEQRLSPGEETRILAVGRLVKQKDFGTLIRAFDLLTRRRLARLTILGEGPERPHLEALARELGIADRVDMPGFVSPPWETMAAASVLAMSSRGEGWPMAIVEALALGIPVVSTDCPTGPREILDNGRFGRLVPVGDPQALSDAIEDAISDPPDPDYLRSRVTPWLIEAIGDRYLDVLMPSATDRRTSGSS